MMGVHGRGTSRLGEGQITVTGFISPGRNNLSSLLIPDVNTPLKASRNETIKESLYFDSWSVSLKLGIRP
jgi:hypothetical protein